VIIYLESFINLKKRLLRSFDKIFDHLALSLFFVLPITLLGQTFDGYVSPLDIPIAVSGTFSEYRKTHFHAGLDMRTEAKIGLKIYSVSSGWVSRIRVSTSGYGKVLYITHHDGYVAVYAHLDGFSNEIQDYVKEQQYLKEQFEVDLHLQKEAIPISVGQLIGFSGNTGSSLGPHLHFEIRNPDNVPINPLKLPYFVPDTIPPIISEILVYHHLEDGLFRQKLNFQQQNASNALYTVDSVQALGPISLGIQMHDRSNLSANVNGVYRVDLKKRGESVFRYQFDEIRFSDRNYINLMIDYPLYRLENQRIQRLYKHPLNHVSVWKHLDDGIINIQENDTVPIRLLIEDHHQNMSVITMNIIGREPEKLINVYPSHEKGTLINRSVSYQLNFDSVLLKIPKKTFYDDVVLEIHQWDQTIDLGTDSFPINNPIEVSFVLNSAQLENKSQYYIAKVNDQQKPTFVTAFNKGPTISTKIRELGTYTVLRDQDPPQINPINIVDGQNMSQQDNIQIQVTDDSGSLLSYHGTINNEWILLEYEPKEDLLVFDFSDIQLPEGEHQLNLSVSDRVGNQANISIPFSL